MVDDKSSGCFDSALLRATDPGFLKALRSTWHRVKVIRQGGAPFSGSCGRWGSLFTIGQ